MLGLASTRENGNQLLVRASDSRPPPTCWTNRSVNDNGPQAAQASGRLPVFIDDRVECLIEVLAVAKERLAKHPFLHGTNLPQCAVAAAIPQRGACFESMHAERFESESQDELRTFLKDPEAPERRPEREAPFGGTEARFGFTHLEDPDCGVLTSNGHREAGIGPGSALPVRPGDEPFEPVDGRRRRRDEARH